MRVEVEGKVVGTGFLTSERNPERESRWIAMVQEVGADKPPTMGKVFVAGTIVLGDLSVGSTLRLAGELSWSRRDGSIGLYRAERVGMPPVVPHAASLAGNGQKAAAAPAAAGR